VGDVEVPQKRVSGERGRELVGISGAGDGKIRDLSRFGAFASWDRFSRIPNRNRIRFHGRIRHV